MGEPVVYLIGAGPGDPGLITVKGIECVAKADVVIYDYLANAHFLASARADAEVLYVGKKGFSQHVTQDEINALIVEKASEGGGRTIARLKGGDPFIFGRGGEEALALAEAGIRFEIVPGVSSGYAAPAYAGIPVTHRGITADVAFVTGHEDPTKETTDVNWEHLATCVGTICFFMGVKNLSEIAGKLIEFGRPADTPVALVRWGTTPRQEVLTGTLSDIADKVAAAGFEAPAITIVGDVVQLRDKLRWFEDRPLFGKSVVVTRSRAQASELSDLLSELGAEVLEFPTIRIEEPESFDLLDEAIRNLEMYHWVVFTSVNAVDKFFERLAITENDARALATTSVAAIGPATSARCRTYGIKADYVPDQYVAESVLAGFEKRHVGEGTNILLPRAAEARAVLPDTLRGWGARVDVIAVYRTVLGPGDGSVLERLQEGGVDVVTFTSSSTVKNFAKLTEAIDLEAALRGTLVASIGPVTSETARGLGLKVDIEAEEFTIPSLVDTISRHFAAS